MLKYVILLVVFFKNSKISDEFITFYKTHIIIMNLELNEI